MSTGAQRLARLTRSDSPLVLSGAVVAQVLSMGADDRDVVASADGGNTVQTMRCLSGYPVRSAGDLVLAVLVGARWHVLGKMGAPPAPETVTPDEMTTAIDKAVSGAIDSIDIPPTIKVTWGQGAPSGTGWRLGTAVYARDDGDGDRTVYLDLSTPPDDGGGSDKPPPPPPPTKPPAPVTISPNNQAGWRGSQRDDNPKQGDASPWGAPGQWVGAWFYGNKIKDACAGKTVTGIQVEMVRQRGGIFGSVTMRMGTHARSTIGKPSLRNRWNGPSIPVGGSAWAHLPADARNDLINGGGIGIGAISSAGYAVMSTTSGRVKITFG